MLGATGRVGLEICRGILGVEDLVLAAAVDPKHAGKPLSDFGVESDLLIVASVDELSSSENSASEDSASENSASENSASEIDVAVDFTVLDAARKNLAWAATHGVHMVVGTTGFTDEDLETIRAGLSESNCIIAPNFSLGAILMMRFSEMAAPFFESAEIIEFHHENKIDAPSGTAMMTAQRMAAASSDWMNDPTTNEVLPGARGGEGPEGIRVHGVRMKGTAANQEVILGTAGQTLTIRHDTIDRTSYVPGVLLALRAVPDRAGLTMGLDDVLGL